MDCNVDGPHTVAPGRTTRSKFFCNSSLHRVPKFRQYFTTGCRVLKQRYNYQCRGVFTTVHRVPKQRYNYQCRGACTTGRRVPKQKHGCQRRGVFKMPTYVSYYMSQGLYEHRKRVCTESTLRTSLSGTSLQTLPDSVTPL